MSLAFQNAESVKQAILEELQNLLTSETSVLKLATERMKQLEFTEVYGVYLAELIMNQSFELPLRQIACIMLTRYVENHWTEYDEYGNHNEASNGGMASDQAKRSIRNILLNGLYDPNSKIRLSVAHTITAIATTDWPNIWTDLAERIVECLDSNEDAIHGAMQVLKDFSYDEKLINKLGPVVITKVYHIFESDQLFTVKTRASAIKLLKSLIASINMNICDKQKKLIMMNDILNMFMEKLCYYLSMNCGNSSNFLFRTEIVKLFTYLSVEQSKYLLPYMERILPIIWQLLTQIADTYVKVVVNQTEPSPFAVSADLDEDEQFTKMISQILEFITYIISVKKYHKFIKNVIADLIYIVIVYSQVSEEQIEEWNEDPEKFVDDEDESGVELTIRLSSQELLQSLTDEAEYDALKAMQEALGRHMNVAKAEEAAGNANWWKIQEACMVAVHIFRDLILDNEDQFDLLNYLTFVRNLLHYSELPYLVGRALWTLSTYSNSKIYNPQMLQEILNVTRESLAEDKSIVLRISAVRAIQGFVVAHMKASEDKRALIRSHLSAFLDGILSLIPGCKSLVLALLLTSLNDIIKSDAGFAVLEKGRLIPLTIAIFLKYTGDPYIMDMIQSTIRSLSQIPQCLETLQDKFIPTIVSILQLQGANACEAKQDIALDVLTTIVKYSKPPLSNAMVENAFPAMVQCVLHSDDHAVMVSGGECIRALIFVSAEQIYGYNNGEGLNFIMQLTTMLLNPMNNEMTAGQIGRLVITIITKMGNMLGENVDLLLKAVISKMQLVDCLKVIMNLVVIFAHLILTQMDAVLNFLSTVPGPTGEPAIQFVLTNWLSKQPSFFGSYERKITTTALCKLFEYGITSQDSRLTSITFKEMILVENSGNPQRIKTRSRTAGTKQWVTMPALVKIFKLLVNELTHLQELRLEEDYEDDDDTDGYDPTNGAGGDMSSNSASKPRFISDLCLDDDEIENSEDDQLMQSLVMNDSLFQSNMEETLTQFLQHFSTSEHFNKFAEQLNESEKTVLRSIRVDVP